MTATAETPLIALPDYVNPGADLTMDPSRRMGAVLNGFAVLREILVKTVADRYDLAMIERTLGKAFATASRCVSRVDTRIEAYKAIQVNPE